MGSSIADVGRVVRPPGRWAIDRRLMTVAIVGEIAAVGLAYLAVYVPVLGPKLTREEATRHWLAAVVAAMVVALWATYVVRAALRARRRSPLPAAAADSPEASDESKLPRIPYCLRFERVPAVWVWAALAFSLATIPITVAAGAHLWLIWLAILSPWWTIIALEARHKHARDAMFAIFGLLVVLQLLHMVEHSTQLAQLAITGGALAKAHGVIGQLDFETVHFFADTTLWISLGLLAISFKGRNAWLWVAFGAASLHQIEHLYLFWMYVGEHTVYLSGGAAGIMGHYGLIGTPLDRPYLHYTYNFIVIVPMMIAFWDEARRVDRVHRLAGPPATTN
jgi:hypothetical protein